VAISRLLVVDDDLEVHRLVRTILKRAEYAIQACFSPVQALESARQSAPDLVITDVMMPMMDGWTFVKSLRSVPSCGLVPVIFLTTATTTEDYIRGFRLGADDYLDKASEFWNLGERVERALARRREIETSVRPAPSQASGSLKGKFDQIGLASLLTVLELGKKGGISPPTKG
jgi:DNA-binding response OmpR family regulator